jgi:hypothetical protein
MAQFKIKDMDKNQTSDEHDIERSSIGILVSHLIVKQSKLRLNEIGKI